MAHCPRIYFSQLVGWSKIFLEKKLEKDNLIQRPTTYKQAGIYKFKNKRIKSLFDCVCNIFRPELNTFQLLQTLGYEATRLSKNEPDTFIRIMKSAERIGKSSADLFRFCINQYDSDLIESEISSNIQTYKRNWDNTLSKEKLNL